MEIKRKISKVNRTLLTNKINEFIVIHYVGAVSTAKDNADYFYDVNRGASAHFFTDEIETWQIVETYNAAWHVGLDPKTIERGKIKYATKCRNNNSIGIEMCCKKDSNGNWYFEEETVNNTIALVQELMERFNIPIENVIRHYDCWIPAKVCPEPFVRDEKKWLEFKERIAKGLNFKDGEELEALDYLTKKLRITDKEYWLKALDVVHNQKWVIIKWANDVKKLENNGIA